MRRNPVECSIGAKRYLFLTILKFAGFSIVIVGICNPSPCRSRQKDPKLYFPCFSSEAGIFQVRYFQISDVAPALTAKTLHLSACISLCQANYSRWFFNPNQEQNSTSAFNISIQHHFLFTAFKASHPHFYLCSYACLRSFVFNFSLAC